MSVWRTILVANEWTELQSVRKTDIRFTLFFLGFVLLGMYRTVRCVFSVVNLFVLCTRSTYFQPHVLPCVLLWSIRGVWGVCLFIYRTFSCI